MNIRIKLSSGLKCLPLLISALMLLVSGCSRVADGTINGTPNTNTSGNTPDEILEAPDFFLPQTATPMLWGEYYYSDPGDSLLAGSSDTLRFCSDTSETSYYYSYTQMSPIYSSPEEFKTMIHFIDSIPLLNPGKIYTKDDIQYITDINRGIHFFDNTDPANPVKIGFLFMPGALDIAIKNNTLYANTYSLLAAVDISDPQNPELKKLEKAFPAVYKYGQPMLDSNGGVAVAWKVDTLYECDDWMYYEYGYDDMAGGPVAAPTAMSSSSGESAGGRNDTFGEGGSMARFALNSNYLYAADPSYLNVIDISEDNNPVDVDDIYVTWGLETTFLTDDALFLGANTGMFIYDLSTDAGSPVFASEYSHITSCDPVIVEDTIAWVTLRSGTSCNMGSNELMVISVADIYNPTELTNYEMQNPHGLDLLNDILVICEGSYGFRIYDASNPLEIELLGEVTDIHAYDVIMTETEIRIVGDDGFYQYSYEDPTNPVLLSYEESTGTGMGDNPRITPILIDPMPMPMPEPVIID